MWELWCPSRTRAQGGNSAREATTERSEFGMYRAVEAEKCSAWEDRCFVDITPRVCNVSSAWTSLRTVGSLSQGAMIPMCEFGRRMPRRRCVGSRKGLVLIMIDKPSKRQEEKLDYQNSLKKKYAAFPEIRKIARWDVLSVFDDVDIATCRRYWRRWKIKRRTERRRISPCLMKCSSFRIWFVKQTRKTTEGNMDATLLASSDCLASSWLAPGPWRSFMRTPATSNNTFSVSSSTSSSMSGDSSKASSVSADVKLNYSL